MIQVPLKLKYRSHKPRSKNKADYGGNSGKSAPKGQIVPVGIRKHAKRKKWSR